MTKCEECGKNSYVIYLTKEHRKICGFCNDKRERKRYNMDSLRDRFYEDGIVEDGHFVLNSGKHTDKYIYKDKIYCNTKLFGECVNKLTDLIINSGVEMDCIASPSAGGVVLGSPVAVNLVKPLIYGEKNSDGTFRLRRCFREYVKNKKIIIVDDIYSSGKTIYNLFDVIKENGGALEGVFCIWNRSVQKSLDRSFFIDIRSLISIYINAVSSEDCYQCKEGLPITNLK